MSLELHANLNFPGTEASLGAYSPVLTDRITRRPGAGSSHGLCGRFQDAKGVVGTGVQGQ